MSRECRGCGRHIPNWIKIDGVGKNLKNRKYCLDCSPWGRHNTRADINKKSRSEKYGEWSDERKKMVIRSVKARGFRRKEQLIELAGGECKKCGKKYVGCPSYFCFHHRDRSKKIFILAMNNLWSKRWELILEEFSKCDLMCLNCHAELEWELGGGFIRRRV